jgi:hypothetical protein
MSSNHNGSILDTIFERVNNIEESTNKQIIHRVLDEAIKLNAQREFDLRKSTISIRSTNDQMRKDIRDAIEDEWVGWENECPVAMWYDKFTVFCEFSSQEKKMKFLQLLRSSNDKKMVELSELTIDCDIAGPDSIRREIRVIIADVRSNVKADILQSIIEKLIKPPGKVQCFKEGRLLTNHNGPNQATRNILFRLNSAGFEQLFGKINGVINYLDIDTNTRVRLFAKVNCKPFQCRDCYIIGMHKCEGKMCQQCGSRSHSTSNCKSKLRSCSNCRRQGHRAKDLHCPYFLNEAVKELRRMCIPIDWMVNESKRFFLVKNLKLK